MDGDRSPTDSAAARIDRAVATSASSRSAAIDAAFSQFSDLGDDGVSSARTSQHDDEPSGDDREAAPPPVKSPAPDQGSDEPAEGDKPAPEGQQSQPASKDTLDAPKHWPKDRRDQFAMLPDEAKRIILERNKEANIAVTKAQQEAAQARRTHEAYSGLFTDDHKRQMREAGMDELGAVRYLVQQHDALNRDPVGFIKAVIANAGIKPEQLFGPAAAGQQPAAQPAAPEEAEWVDPAVAKALERLARLEEQETARQRAAEQHRQSEQQRFNRWFAEQCNAFENAIGDDGNPKYPHLPAVINDVIRLVQSDPAAKSLLLSRPAEALENAYNQALYLNPDIRQQLIEADFERRQSAADAQNAVKKAQAAATRKGSPGASGQAHAGRMSREEAIAKAMRDAGL